MNLARKIRFWWDISFSWSLFLFLLCWFGFYFNTMFIIFIVFILTQFLFLYIIGFWNSNYSHLPIVMSFHMSFLNITHSVFATFGYTFFASFCVCYFPPFPFDVQRRPNILQLHLLLLVQSPWHWQNKALPWALYIALASISVSFFLIPFLGIYAEHLWHECSQKCQLIPVKWLLQMLILFGTDMVCYVIKRCHHQCW